MGKKQNRGKRREGEKERRKETKNGRIKRERKEENEGRREREWGEGKKRVIHGQKIGNISSHYFEDCSIKPPVAITLVCPLD